LERQQNFSEEEGVEPKELKEEACMRASETNMDGGECTRKTSTTISSTE
jgi:hypothetical protein